MQVSILSSKSVSLRQSYLRLIALSRLSSSRSNQQGDEGTNTKEDEVGKQNTKMRKDNIVWNAIESHHFFAI